MKRPEILRWLAVLLLAAVLALLVSGDSRRESPTAGRTNYDNRREEAIRIISASRPCTPEQATITIELVAARKKISESECVDWFLEEFSRAGVRK